MLQRENGDKKCAWKKTVERNDESYKWLRRQTRCKKKERRKGRRIEGKTNAQVEKEKEPAENEEVKKN